MALANDLIRNRAVTFVPEQKCFIVSGESGRKFSVTLFPKEHCPCSPPGTCPHIVACQLSLGIEPKVQKKSCTRNVAQLSRSAKLPKGPSGRKQPEKFDAGDTAPLPRIEDEEEERSPVKPKAEEEEEEEGKKR